MKSLTKDLLLLSPENVVNLFQELSFDELKELIQWIHNSSQSDISTKKVVDFPSHNDDLGKLKKLFSGAELKKIKQIRKNHRKVA